MASGDASRGEAVHQIHMRVQLLPQLHVQALCGSGLGQRREQGALQADAIPSYRLQDLIWDCPGWAPCPGICA